MLVRRSPAGKCYAAFPRLESEQQCIKFGVPRSISYPAPSSFAPSGLPYTVLVGT